MHLARLTLMLADHHYSALPPDPSERVPDAKQLYANTFKGRLNQPLDVHLVGVAKDVASIAHDLPDFARNLPRLARHRGLARRTADSRFAWQNKAADAAAAMRMQSLDHGAFVINMASTGCGKTLANARILYGLADPRQGMRAAFALGLRTLTLQTGRAYQEKLHLDGDELALRVGGAASRELFEYFEHQAEKNGSASEQALVENDDGHVFFEGQISTDGLLAKTKQEPNIQRLISAPMLVCTIDHLTPATESQRGGQQIAPMLRLMSGDLVLDELDDFDLSDLPALTRLVYWAGLLGTRLLISSATLPPALVEGLYLAYRAGRRHFLRNRGIPRDENPVIACLWVDEIGVQSLSVADDEVFRQQHAVFVEKRVRALAKTEPCRRGELLRLPIVGKKESEIRREFAAHVRDAIFRAHDRHHETDPSSGKTVSFGLVRMANIEPLFDVAQELFRLGAQPEYRIHLCVYHSRFPLILRSAIECRLDNALNRRDPEAVYRLPEIRAALDSPDFPEKNQLFVVLGSPVTEVGRDHDYDWAVVEPSSMRSIIQLAGRVQRHRQKPCPKDQPNILIFDFNLRHFLPHKDGISAAFIRPGFESDVAHADHFLLGTHDLNELLQKDEYKIITARPRIQPRPELQEKSSLVDLEHARLVDMMLPKTEAPRQRNVKADTGLNVNAACTWQIPQVALTWALPQCQPFRDSRILEEVALVLLPDDDEEKMLLHRVYSDRHGESDVYTLCNEGYRHDVELHAEQGISTWGKDDLLNLLREQAEARGWSLRDCAKRFATVKVMDSEQGWRYHPVLGFAKK
jgi:CRISPR-associated endonuclease/helicase Cas3